MAKYLTLDGLQTFYNGLKTKLGTKVDKVEGKGLSTNDYDAAAVAEVAKVADKVDKVEGKGLSTNDYDAAAVAEVAKIANKADAATSLSGYGITDAYTKTETDTAISTAVSSASHLKKAIATAEQIAGFVADYTTANADTIYLVKDDSAEGDDVYKEYTVIGTEFVCIGDTTTDLSDYAKSEDIVAITNDEINNVLNPTEAQG